nr:GntR family transcriptional regulator [Streptomyces canus]
MDVQSDGERLVGREVTRVVTSLQNLIATGGYPPGTTLPPQRLLAEEFDVSRDTVQRALRELTAQGLVASRQGSGTRVLGIPRSPAPGLTGNDAHQSVSAQLNQMGDSPHILSVLLNRIVEGTYPPGAMLPTQRLLAEEFGVSRDTVQRALRELSAEGYVASRQGSGTRVLRTPSTRETPPGERHVGLGAHLSAAFESPTVTIDVFTLTSESLDAQIRVQIERTRARQIQPESISVRLLLPRTDGDFNLPRAVHGPEDHRLLDRLRDIANRHTDSIRHALRELQVTRLVPELQFEHRVSPVAPMQKLYLLNGTELVTGYYQVVRRHVLLDDDEEIEAYDALGLGARLHHHSAGDPGQLAIVGRAKQWFDHAWANAAAPLTVSS